jgi:hypothetical protein
MERFVDADDAYRQWVAGHPDGFVLNTDRSPRATYLILHRASCRMISGEPPGGKRWTYDYVKVCGDREELEEYVRRDVGGAARPCRVCLGRAGNVLLQMVLPRVTW